MERRDFRRVIWLGAGAVCAFVFAALVAQAARQPQNPPPAQTLPAFSSPEIDALAEKLAPEIAKRHFGRVVVFGASGPGDEPTQFGKAVGDVVSESLARRAQGFAVTNRDSLREALKKMRISDSAILDDYLVAWICQKVMAAGAVVLQIKSVEGNKAVVEANLFDWREMEKKTAYSLSATLALDEALTKAATQPANNDGRFLGAGVSGSNDEKDGISNPVCVYCPHPAYSDETSARHFSGDLFLGITVHPNWSTTDISIVKGAGQGLDAKAVDAALNWVVKPGQDADGYAAEKRTIFKVEFQTFGKEEPSQQGPRAGEPLPTRILNKESPEIAQMARCVHCPPPEYTQEAKAEKIQGDVWLEIVVSAEGGVIDEKIARGLAHGLDAQAYKTVWKWKFVPAIDKDGNTVAVRMLVQVQFKLN
jgi:TonB family protein